MNSEVTAVWHLLCDKIMRARNKARRQILNMRVFNEQNSVSDSEATFYLDSLKKIIYTDQFRNFRRDYDYREILEHVDYWTGKKYLIRIADLGFDINELIELAARNDQIGNPRKYSYKNLPPVSPTSLRYLSVACELIHHFKSLDNLNIVEIGAGYGGQYAILSQLFNMKSYSIYDLPEAQSLISEFVSNIKVQPQPTMKDINQIEAGNFDLVISNYAFSELPSAIQEVYLDRILKQSSRGYMIMNSGMHNETQRSFGKISVGKIQEKIENVEILPELPKTSADNYVAIWGREIG